MKVILVSLMLISSLFGASASECTKYKSSFYSALDKTNANSPSNKKYSMLLVKSYFDDLILNCKGMNDNEVFKAKIPEVKKMWNSWVPKNVRDMPQNKWKY